MEKIHWRRVASCSGKGFLQDYARNEHKTRTNIIFSKQILSSANKYHLQQTNIIFSKQISSSANKYYLLFYFNRLRKVPFSRPFLPFNRRMLPREWETYFHKITAKHLLISVFLVWQSRVLDLTNTNTRKKKSSNFCKVPQKITKSIISQKLRIAQKKVIHAKNERQINFNIPCKSGHFWRNSNFWTPKTTVLNGRSARKRYDMIWNFTPIIFSSTLSIFYVQMTTSDGRELSAYPLSETNHFFWFEIIS